MKQLRTKLIALCITICMLSSLIVIPSAIAAAADNRIEYDVLLQRLGISAVKDDVNLITRGDFTVLCVQALNITALTGESYFLDVEGEQAKYINTAAMLDLVVQNEDKLFYPDQPIKAEEAAAICLRMLGYDIFLTGEDAYPNSYISQATKLKLLRNIVVGAQITCSDANEMIFNTIQTEYIGTPYIKGGGDKKYSKTGETYLYNEFGVTKYSGQITSLCGIALNGCQMAEPGKIMINNSVTYYNPYYSDFAHYTYLGCKVTYYTRNVDGEEEVIYILNNTANEKINAKDVTMVSGFNAGDPLSSRRSPQLTYSDGDKKRTMRLSDRATIIKNGVSVISVTNEDFKPESGCVYLTDINSDGSFDVISIEQYSYYYVRHYEQDLGIIIDHYGKQEIRLSEFEDGRVYVFSEGNQSTTIGANSVVEVMCSYNSDGSIDYDKMIRVKAKALTVKGTIEAIDDEGVWIDGARYRVHSTIKEELNDRLNKETTFLLGQDDLIVAYEEFDDTEAIEYAYLVAVHNDRLLGYDFTFRLFLITDKMLDVKLSKDFRYTGMLGDKYVVKRKIKDKDILSTITPYQLVRYSLDADGKLSLLETAYDHSEDEDYIGFDLNRFTLDYKNSSAYVWAGYVGDYNAIRSNTTCFYVSTDSIEEEDFKIGLVNHITYKALSGASIKLYNTDKSLRGEIMVIENYATPHTAEADFMSQPTSIVVDKKMKRNEDDEYVTHLTLYNNASLTEYVADSEDLAPSNDLYWNIPHNRVQKISDLEVGDMIIYQIGMNRNIIRYIVIGEYDPTFTESYYQGFSKPSNLMSLAQIAILKGRITSFIDGSYFTVDASGDQKHCFVRRNTVYYEVDTNFGTVKRSTTIPHLNVGDYVFVDLFRSDVSVVVKYIE